MKFLFSSCLVFLSIASFGQDYYTSLDSALHTPEKVRHLYINEHLFEDFPEITSLVNLESIGLRYCKDFSDVFVKLSKLPKLNKLIIKDVEMESLPVSVGLIVNLETLVLEQCKLRNLPDEVAKLRKLKVLSLKENEFENLPEAILDLPQLEALDLSQNRLVSLGENAFPGLKRIDASNNLLDSLPTGFFKNENLIELDLADNNLGLNDIEEVDLPKLEVLNLARNQITDLPSGFWNSSALTKLNLSDNAIDALGGVEGLRRLQYLKASGNQISSLPPEIAKLSELTFVDLHGNMLRNLPKDFFHISSLTSVDLSFNELTEIPDFTNTPIRFLALMENKIVGLPESISGLSELQVLLLNGNEISKLPESFGALQDLNELEVRMNKLGDLPNSFGNLSNLVELDLGENQFTSFPEELRSLKKLTKIDMGYNTVGELDPVLLQNKALVKLECPACGLTNIQASGKIRELFIQGNAIADMKSIANAFPNLIELDVTDNQLTTVYDSLSRFADLTSLFIGGNEISEKELEEVTRDFPNLQVDF